MKNPSHWIILIVVLLLVFGAKKLPDMARSIGQSMKIFKKEIKDLTEDDDSTNTQATPAPSVTAEPAQAKREETA